MAVLLLLFYVPSSFSQSANALYLKDGSRIIGYVLNLDSVGVVSMRTTEGEMVTVPMSNVDNINWSYEIKQSGVGAIYRYADRFRWVYNNEDLSDRNYERFFDDDLPVRPIMARDLDLLEVKYDTLLPDHLRQVMNLKNMRYTSFSKYELCRRMPMRAF